MIRPSFKNLGRNVKENIHVLYVASRDARVPLLPKVILAVVVAYILSPIDLIPDFIPILGYVDDFLIVTLGLWFAIRLIPVEVWEECQERADQQSISLPQTSRVGIIIVSIWILVFTVILIWSYLAFVKK